MWILLQQPLGLEPLSPSPSSPTSSWVSRPSLQGVWITCIHWNAPKLPQLSQLGIKQMYQSSCTNFESCSTNNIPLRSSSSTLPNLVSTPPVKCGTNAKLSQVVRRENALPSLVLGHHILIESMT
jgi:hypothetical protein